MNPGLGQIPAAAERVAPHRRPGQERLSEQGPLPVRNRIAAGSSAAGVSFYKLLYTNKLRMQPITIWKHQKKFRSNRAEDG